MKQPARRARMACACVLALLVAPWSHGAQIPEALKPSGVFVQAGAGRQVASVALGASWDWDWRYDATHARITGATQVLIGDWRARDPGGDFTQVGIMPVLRLSPHGWQRGWFLEGGIGANAITSHYENRGKRFSTVFQFGDHVGVGRRFGPAMEHEVVLGVTHYSNAGVRHPNPGENFLQLQYLRRF
jgi:lipid A 3-O-deacylase